MKSRSFQFLVALSVTAMAPPCLSQLPPPVYGIKGDAPTGSNIRGYVTQGSRVPVNRTYAELSDEDKAILNRYYETIEPGDEPPFPLQGLAPIHKAIATAQEKLRASGPLVVVASVEPDGSVAQVKTTGSPSPEMTQVAASIILRSKFKPALCKGVPCRMDFPFSFEFVVQRN